MDQTDKEYVESSRDGNPEDFRFLVDRYQAPVFSYLRSLLGDYSTAEEAAQESFVRAFFSLRKLRKPESFHSWVLGIARHVAKECFRAAGRRQDNLEESRMASPDSEDHHADEHLEEAIAALPESYRRVILLRYYEEISCQEIAERLGMPLGTVTKTLSRAYAMLRQSIKASEGSEANIHQEVQL